MKRKLFYSCIFMFLSFSLANGQEYIAKDGKINLAVVKNRHKGPEVIYTSGLEELLIRNNSVLARTSTVKLSPAEDREYGEWNIAAIENKHIGQLVSDNRKDQYFNLGLLKNCTDLLGMLAGLQNMKPAIQADNDDERNLQASGLAGHKPLRVGLVWIDAHADFNTPETTLSGMLGGMPVAIASGQCLTRLRLKTGLDPALPTRYITMTCLRDVDPLEQDLLDRSLCEYLSVNDIRNQSTAIQEQIDRLSGLTDIIYVHIDMDVLDPAEVSGHPLTAPEGPSSIELAAALKIMFSNQKVSALGIASMPYGTNDPDGLSLKATYNLIEGALEGVNSR